MKKAKKTQRQLNKESELRGRWNRQEYLQERSGCTCDCCSAGFPIEALDLHHRVPETKTMKLDYTAFRGKKVKQKVLDEAATCDVLCKNCHALEHKAHRKGESIVHDKEAYFRFRNHRDSYPSTFKGTYGRNTKRGDTGDKQLLLSI